MASVSAKRGSARPWAAVLKALGNAYGAPRRGGRRSKVDLAVIALLADGRGERTASRWVAELIDRFVDWNEIRVAKLRDLSGAQPDASEEALRKMLAFLQALYEALGGLDLSKLSAMNAAEVRAWLERLQVLEREDIDAVLMIALGAATLPGGETLARISRRMGLAPRKATRARVHKMALKALAPGAYRDFHDLIGEHAAAHCREEKPDCRRCAVRPLCRSRGKW